MQTVNLEVDREHARDMYRQYLKQKHYDTDVDAEIRAAYRAIAAGHTVIAALDSIRKAGAGTDGLPKLAIARADAKVCAYRTSAANESVFMSDNYWRASRSRVLVVPHSGLPDTRGSRYTSLVPAIPHRLRPKSDLAQYHILYEAVWTRDVSPDPFLLKRIGKADMWLVVAAWDLSAIEVAALQARLQ